MPDEFDNTNNSRYNFIPDEIDQNDNDGPMSLYEHCKIESGGLEGFALEQYMRRYYSVG